MIAPKNSMDSASFDASAVLFTTASDKEARAPRRPESGDRPNLDPIFQQLYQMTLLSLSGYQEIAVLTTNERLRTFAEVMVRQRQAQCNSFTQMCPGFVYDPNYHNPAAIAVRAGWLCAMWNLDRKNFIAFAAHVERAEMLLEEAYAKAARKLGECVNAAALRQYAVNVCGARERCEEIGDALFYDR